MSRALASPLAFSALIRFSRHELRLAWRDWAWIFSGWRKTGLKRTLIGMGLFYAVLHLIAYAVLAPQFAGGFQLDQTALAVISVSVLLSFTMMLSQAIESVTRAFYARDDLDLILSSPAPSRDLFLVRIAMMALTSWVMSALVISPFLNVAAALGGPHWLSGYLVILAASLTATGAGILMTLALFQTVGAKRTRLLAQILAAVVGAAFLIGLQVVAILSFGSMSRFALFEADFLRATVPAAGSLWWFPARAVAGKTSVVALMLAGSFAFFAIGAWCGAVQFRRIVVKALGVAETTRRSRATHRPFRGHSALGALVTKELKLIARDPWLVSQTLMQVLYLVPPAVMLWVSFGANTEISVLVAPVIVMATGQLAGGLAWLTISGEDAPDLIATAPLSVFTRLAAKVLAAQALIVAVLLPITLALAALSIWGALITFLGALIAASCAILIQLWFRAQASRTTFRRRQVASKASTFAEAGASISCAGATALVAAGSVLAVLPVVLLGIVLGVAWGVRPRGNVGV
ncbi:permease [Roseibium sp.]|uniref:permease n=1 Tax=Roseibium sp. TaxID=1936156 RepID=UPI003BB0CE42